LRTSRYKERDAYVAQLDTKNGIFISRAGKRITYRVAPRGCGSDETLAAAVLVLLFSNSSLPLRKPVGKPYPVDGGLRTMGSHLLLLYY
jgi:hypothetical protein